MNIITVEPTSGDNQPAIQEAIDKAQLMGDMYGRGRGVVRLSPGIFRIDSALRVSESGVCIRGEGIYNTTIHPTFEEGDAILVARNNGMSLLQQFMLSDINIMSFGVEHIAGSYIRLMSVANSYIRNVHVSGGYIGILCSGVHRTTFDNVHISGSKKYVSRQICSTLFELSENPLYPAKSYCSAIRLINCTFNIDNPDGFIDNCIWVRAVDGLYMVSVHTLGHGVAGLNFDPYSDSPIGGVLVSSSHFDQGASNGHADNVVIQGETDKWYQSIRFSSCLFNGQGISRYGLVLKSEAEVDLSNCKFQNFKDMSLRIELQPAMDKNLTLNNVSLL